jgi:hypothetical protein
MDSTKSMEPFEMRITTQGNLSSFVKFGLKFLQVPDFQLINFGSKFLIKPSTLGESRDTLNITYPSSKKITPGFEEEGGEAKN